MLNSVGSTLGSHGPAAIPHAFTVATYVNPFAWTHLSDIGDVIVVVFGLLLWVSCLLSLAYYS